jgi:hypothetical protein
MAIGLPREFVQGIEPQGEQSLSPLIFLQNRETQLWVIVDAINDNFDAVDLKFCGLHATSKDV